MLTSNENFDAIAEFLTYRSYEWQRIHSPSVDLDRWKLIYPNAEKYEEIFQSKKMKEKNDGK